MPSNDYHFVTTWTAVSTLEQVNDILSDGPGLARWWPSVYIDVRELQPGGERGVGKVVELHTKGWLPHTLVWWFRVNAASPVEAAPIPPPPRRATTPPVSVAIDLAGVGGLIYLAIRRVSAG